MVARFRAIHSTTLRSSAFLPPDFVSAAPAISQLMYMSIALHLAEYKNRQSIRRTCKLDQEFDRFRRRELMRDPGKINRD